jgi:hypothetical protein
VGITPASSTSGAKGHEKEKGLISWSDLKTKCCVSANIEKKE